MRELPGLEESYGVSASAVADDATDGPGKIALKGGRGPALAINEAMAQKPKTWIRGLLYNMGMGIVIIYGIL